MWVEVGHKLWYYFNPLLFQEEIEKMRVDQIDTLIEQLEDFIKAAIHVEQAKSQGYDQMSAASDMILSNMRTSLKEYLVDLAGLKKAIDADALECPECGGKMKERKNRQTGNVFYGCLKFPDCKGTRDEDGLSRDERNAKKEPVEQQNGFSFKRT